MDDSYIMDIYPDFYLKSVLDITPEFCKKNNIKGLILDVDNTLIDMNRKMLERSYFMA